MRIAYVTVYDPRDPGAWSGKYYYMAQEFSRQLSVTYLGPLRKTKYLPLLGAKYIFYKYLLKQWYTLYRDRLLIKDYAHQISRKLSGLDADIVFSTTSPGSQPIAYLECDQPIVIWADATLAGAMHVHPSFSLLCAESRRDGLANEESALSRCTLAIYSSEWAAQSAIEHYPITPSRVKVVPFGPGLPPHGKTVDEIKTIVESRPSDICKLLFVGLRWHAKGGDIAYQVAKALNEMGVNTELTVVGCRPPIKPLLRFVRSVGFISKATKAGVSEIERLYAEAHFLIVPSRAEAFGRVFCEASSFGVPSLATNVGGIPTAVRDV